MCTLESHQTHMQSSSGTQVERDTMIVLTEQCTGPRRLALTAASGTVSATSVRLMVAVSFELLNTANPAHGHMGACE